MKAILLASTALLIALAGPASASGSIDLSGPAITAKAPALQFADNGSDDGSDHDSGDDKGGDNDDDSNDDDDDSGSGRKKVRVPGGSGCDDAGDVAEHSECKG